MKKTKLFAGILLTSLFLCGCGKETPDTPVCPECPTCPECPEHTHVLEKHEAVAPTYTEKGSKEYYSCASCGKYYSDAKAETEIKKDSWILDPLAPQKLAITAQPKVVDAKLGDIVEFTVEVNDPSQVESYQWEYCNEINKEGVEFWNVFDRANEEATLTVYGARPRDEGRFYRCRITAKDGGELVTEKCYFNLPEYVEGDAYVVIGSRVLVAGKELDLSTTPYGTGKVSLDEDGRVLRLTNVNYHNINFDTDPMCCEVGIYYQNWNYDSSDFTVVLSGKNTIINSYYQPSSNGSGIDFGFFFGKEGLKPTVSIQRTNDDANLSCVGGSHCIYANSPLSISADLILQTYQSYWNTGVHATAIAISPNISIKADLNGYLFEANNEDEPSKAAIIVNSGVQIDYNCSVGIVSAGSSNVNAFTTSGMISMFGATININIVADKNRLPEHKGFGSVTAMSADEAFMAYTSKINITMTSNVDEEDRIGSFTGISCGSHRHPGAMDFVGCPAVNVIIDAKYVPIAYAILTDEMTVTQTNVMVDIVAGGEAGGLLTNGDMDIYQSYVNVIGTTYHIEGFGDRFNKGICAGGKLIIENESTIIVDLDMGVAVGALMETENEEFDPGYVVKNLQIDIAEVIVPTSIVKNKTTVIYDKGKKSMSFETLFDSADTSKPLTSVKLSVVAN